MRLAPELTTRLASEFDGADEPRSEIMVDGEPTGKFVPGAVLEAAIAWERSFLLFMTDDVVYEEFLRILLLDRHLRIVDSAMTGAPYSTGTFSTLQLNEPNTVSFRFVGDTMWSVDLLSHPAIRLPLISDPKGVYRPLGFWRRFAVRGDPRPQPR